MHYESRNLLAPTTLLVFQPFKPQVAYLRMKRDFHQVAFFYYFICQKILLPPSVCQVGTCGGHKFCASKWSSSLLPDTSPTHHHCPGFLYRCPNGAPKSDSFQNAMFWRMGKGGGGKAGRQPRHFGLLLAVSHFLPSLSTASPGAEANAQISGCLIPTRQEGNSL